MLRPAVLFLLSAVLLVVASPARADGIVLESYVGNRPDNANFVLRSLLEELARRDFLSSGAAIQFESRVSKPALTEAGLPVDFVPQVEKGHKAWISGNFTDSLQLLQPLVQKAHENPGAFAQNQQQLRDRMFKALMGIAVSQLKMGDRGAAKATFGEILRSFPDQTVSRSVYGPDVSDVYDATKKELGALKRGTLIVNLTGDTGPIYINEKFENVGKVSKMDLYAGEYRVFAAPAKGITRNHRVSIGPGETVTLTIDTGFDLALQASSEWIGFSFANAQDRADNEALYATKLAKLLDKDSVVVVGIEQSNGRPVLVAALVDMLGRKDLRRASIALDPSPAPRTVLGLAKFVTSGEETEGIQVQVANKPSVGTGGGGNVIGPIDGPAPSGSKLWGGWKWIAAGAAAGTLAVGAYLVAIDGDCADAVPPSNPANCVDNYNHTGAAWATVAGGAVVAGVSIYLFARGDGSASAQTRTGYLVPTSGGAMAGYSFKF